MPRRANNAIREETQRAKLPRQTGETGRSQVPHLPQSPITPARSNPLPPIPIPGEMSAGSLSAPPTPIPGIANLQSIFQQTTPAPDPFTLALMKLLGIGF